MTIKTQIYLIGDFIRDQNNSEAFGKYFSSPGFLYDVFIIALIVAAGAFGWYHGRKSGYAEGAAEHDRPVGF